MYVKTNSGRNRAEEAAMAAISSALLDVPITGAQGIVFNVLGGRDMSLQVTYAVTVDMFIYLKFLHSLLCMHCCCYMVGAFSTMLLLV
jgi:FtsZ family, C-terminal domain